MFWSTGPPEINLASYKELQFQITLTMVKRYFNRGDIELVEVVNATEALSSAQVRLRAS